MSKEPEPTARKSITLPVSVWAAVDDVRRQMPGRVPSETVVVCTLIRAGLVALRDGSANA